MSNNKKILLVEDDDLMVKMYRNKFEREGFKVNVALDGQAGLDALKKEKPDLILLDIMMPKMDGFEMLARVKDDPTVKDIPVVIFTNLGGENDAEKGLRMGAVLHLIKSEFTPAEVVEKVKKVLKI